jgi:YegS/Rv2252/BmrU family lipid kinase
MKVTVILNPRSGRQRAAPLRPEAEKLAHVQHAELTVRMIEGPGDGTRFAHEAVANGADRVIAIGGDGTLNAVAAGLVGTPVPLGIVPMGSGNGYARSLKLPRDPLVALHTAFTGKAEPMDVCYMNDRLFLGTAGIGFDARVAWKFDQSTGRGMWTYMRIILREILGADPMRVVTKANNAVREDQVLMMVFCNTREFGNGAVISPGSAPDDGLAELRIVAKPPFLPMIIAFIRMYNGRIDGSPYVNTIVTKEAEVHQAGRIAHLDGEPVEIGNTVRFRLDPRKLQVVR